MYLSINICCFRLSSMCKHIAALLFTVVDRVAAGGNTQGHVQAENRHGTSQKTKISTSAFLTEIQTPKAGPSMSMSEGRLLRDNFDPRREAFRRKRSLGDYDLDALAEVSNWQASVLLYAAGFRSEEVVSEGWYTNYSNQRTLTETAILCNKAR